GREIGDQRAGAVEVLPGGFALATDPAEKSERVLRVSCTGNLAGREQLLARLFERGDRIGSQHVESTAKAEEKQSLRCFASQLERRTVVAHGGVGRIESERTVTSLLESLARSERKRRRVQSGSRRELERLQVVVGKQFRIVLMPAEVFDPARDREVF